MLIQDLQFIEQTEESSVHGGASAFTGVSVNANGAAANADAYGFGFGDSTGAGTNTGTRTASGRYYDLAASTGSATSYGVTLDGKNSSYETSVSTGVATDVRVRF